MRIYEVKRIHLEKFPDSHFFDHKTLKFFGQTLADFTVTKHGRGEYWITAPRYLVDRASGEKTPAGRTERIFNPESGELKIPEKSETTA